jgi:uncharacterized membrane protein
MNYFKYLCEALFNLKKSTKAKTAIAKTPIKISNNTISIGQKFSDFFARLVRSWKFVILQLVFIFFWIFINVNQLFYHWDKYPFDILKLILTIEASFSASMILMSQNRQSEIDRKVLYMEYDMDKNIKKNIKKIKSSLRSIKSKT